MVLTSTSAMRHVHHWRNEPPEGKLFFNKTFDQRYGDEEDMATNAMWTSPEEIQRLRLMLEKDPDFKTSSNWPQLVEWCSTCTETRVVSLVLPEVERKVPELMAEEEKTKAEESYEPVAQVDHEHVVGEEGSPQPDLETMAGGCEPAAGVKPRRRRGGQGSRRRRLLAFQLMLTEKRGLPMSRLLSSKTTDARSYREEMLREQEESASPVLRRRIVKEEKEEEDIHMYNMEKEEGEGSGPIVEASTGGSITFTPRSIRASVTLPSPDFFPQVPGIPPFPNLLSSFSTPSFSSPQRCGLMPGPQWVVCGGCLTWGTIIPC